MFQRLYFLRTGPNKKELAVALNDVLLLHFRATVFLTRCVAGSKSPSLLRLPGCDQFAPTSPTQNPPNSIQETLQWLGPHLCPGTFLSSEEGYSQPRTMPVDGARNRIASVHKTFCICASKHL